MSAKPKTHAAPPHIERLVAGATIDLPLRRRHAGPERALAWLWRGFWAAFAAAVAARLALS